MKGWFSKTQLSELKIGQFNRKKYRKRKSKSNAQLNCPNPKEKFAQKMRDNPTSSERRLETAMRKVRYEHRWVVNSQVVLGPYIADIFLPNRKVVVEVDGSSHLGREDYDLRRDSFLWNSGFRVIHVTNDEVWSNLTATVAKIVEFVEVYGKPNKRKDLGRDYRKDQFSVLARSRKDKL